MTAETIICELKPLGSEGYRKILLRHGAHEPCFGVKIEELKKYQKRIKKDYALALALYETGVYDAMYLAGLIADDARMTRSDLKHWVNKASAPLAGSTVAWVAAGSPDGWPVALTWIESEKPLIAVAGWSTLRSAISIRSDDDLDPAQLRALLARVQKSIHGSPDPVRYSMNGFVIALGSYVTALTDQAITAAEKIGPVTVDMGETACQVPSAADYIRKVQQRGTVGRKRKTAKC